MVLRILLSDSSMKFRLYTLDIVCKGSSVHCSRSDIAVITVVNMYIHVYTVFAKHLVVLVSNLEVVLNNISFKVENFLQLLEQNTEGKPCNYVKS